MCGHTDKEGPGTLASALLRLGSSLPEISKAHSTIYCRPSRSHLGDTKLSFTQLMAGNCLHKSRLDLCYF